MEPNAESMRQNGMSILKTVVAAIVLAASLSACGAATTAPTRVTVGHEDIATPIETAAPVDVVTLVPATATAAPNPKKVVTLKKANVPTETVPEPVETVAPKLLGGVNATQGGPVSATIDPSQFDGGPDKPIKGVV